VPQGGAPVASAHEPVATAGRGGEGMEQGVAAEAPLEEDHRGVVGERSPHAAGQREFAGARGADGGGCHEIMAPDEERDHAQLRVSRARASGPGGGRTP
jgi:hypothetical protein